MQVGLIPSLSLPELGNPCANDSLEDMKPTNPFLSTDFTCLAGAMSPGSSDVSGQCFALQKGPFACADLGAQWGTAPPPRAGLGLAPGCLQGLEVGIQGEASSDAISWWSEPCPFASQGL